MDPIRGVRVDVDRQNVSEDMLAKKSVALLFHPPPVMSAISRDVMTDTGD